MEEEYNLKVMHPDEHAALLRNTSDFHEYIRVFADKNDSLETDSNGRRLFLLWCESVIEMLEAYPDKEEVISNDRSVNEMIIGMKKIHQKYSEI